MTNLEKAEMHRDKVEMELEEAEKLLTLISSSPEATQHEVDVWECDTTRLRDELVKAKDEVTVAVYEEAFKNLNNQELRKVAKDPNVDWKVSSVALNVLAWKAERDCERKAS
jgi:hypothetical protein